MSKPERYTLTKTYENEHVVQYHPSTDVEYTTEQSEAAFGCEFDDVPSNLNDFIDAIVDLSDEWADAEYKGKADTRPRSIHTPTGTIIFRNPSYLQMYAIGLWNMWEIIDERLPYGFPPDAKPMNENAKEDMSSQKDDTQTMHDNTEVTLIDIQTRYEDDIDRIQQVINSITAEEQVELDYKMDFDTDKIHDAIRYLHKAKTAICAARRAAIN